MPYKDLHESPFDETTIAKLKLFEDYTQAWLPTFIMRGYNPVLHIFDFFAGTGYDLEGVSGSPIRILDKINEQIGPLYQKNVQVILHLNEYEPSKKKQEKYQLLEHSCNEYLSKKKSLNARVQIEFYNEDFEDLFPKLYPTIKAFPSLVFLDQNGIKFLSEKYFLELEKTKETDFLYFVSSSYFWRFGDSEQFKVHLKIDMDQIKNEQYHKIHRSITEQIRQKLPFKTKLKLYPFSLKKGTNIHGIIFGASHPRAVDKFLDIAWKTNKINGDANFDIDDEATIDQLEMFNPPRLSKIQSFQKNLKEKLLQKEITNNFQALDYTYGQGHIPAHAIDTIKELVKDKKITYNGRTSGINYNQVHKLRNLITYSLK
ncbi:MAG: three-Cys-motif partner protein TcmP [Cytophagia bacterium]|nr:three-Cys-motif partner protein TcmP [Cytophagia bacterium]